MAADAERCRSQQRLYEACEERLAHLRAGLQTVKAVRPVLKKYVERRRGGLFFRLMQVLSGHGCFREYLYRIVGREATTRCHECGHTEDTAQHTLEHYPRWADQRRVIRRIIGWDLPLPAVVKTIVGSDKTGGSGLLLRRSYGAEGGHRAGPRGARSKEEEEEGQEAEVHPSARIGPPFPLGS